MNGEFTHFFKVVIDGYYEVVCSKCDMMLTEDPQVNIIYEGPARGPGIIQCCICGITPDSATEEENPESDGQ